MKWKRTKNNEHSFYDFDMNEHNKEIEWAFKTAKIKTENTINSYKQRTPLEKFANIFLGDLAKNLVKTFLTNEAKESGKYLVEYDLIRKDNFKYHDKYDLKFKDENQSFNIEVKASGEKYSKNVDNLFNRRIIINKNNVHEKVEPIVFQVIFVPNDLNFFKDETLEKYKDFDFETAIKFYKEEFISQDIKPYIVGYANEKMQIEALEKQFDVKNHSYGDLKISESKAPEKFVVAMSNYLKKSHANKVSKAM